MKSFTGFISGQARSDTADSTVITTVFVWPILLMMLITMVEVPILFSNRNLLQNDLRQGARTSAILGGVKSTLGSTYGAANSCSTISKGVESMLASSANDAVSCVTADSIGKNSGFIAFKVFNVQCGPNQTTKVGDATYCEASFYYSGIPGGSVSLIGGAEHFGYGDAAGLTSANTATGQAEAVAKQKIANGQGGFNFGTLRMSAQSEVQLGD